jgi:PAS domain S-box-containing protein
MRAERAITVLAVDDDATSRRATLRLLRQAGYRTRQAASGKQALRIVAQKRPDLVVLSDDLEGARGPEVARQIKQLPEGTDLPILHVASAQAAPGRLPEEVELWRDGYLSRQADPVTLVTLAEALLRARRAEAALGDLTRAREEAEERRRFLEAILDNAPGGIVAFDAQARVLLSNPTVETILARPAPIGQDYQKLAGLHLLRPNGTPFSPRDLPPVRAALDGETVTGAEATVILPDGARREMLGSARPVRDEEGEIIGAILVFQDITEHKQTQRESERLSEVERARGREARVLEAILEATPSLTAYLDRDLCYRVADPRYASGLGFTREGIVGKCHAEIFAHAPWTTAWLEQVRESGETMAVHEIPSASPLPGRPPDGAVVDVTMTPVKDERGEVEGIVLFVIDVTEQVQAREAIAAAGRERAREARMLTTILEAVPGMVAYLDRDLRYRHVNAKMARAFGRTREQLLGLAHHDGLYPLSADAKENMARLFRTGDPVIQVEQKPIFPITWRDATPYDAFNVSVIPVKDDQGEVEGMVVFIMDVTEAVAQREQRLEAERARARLAETLNEEINHRVKNNLMMVVGLLQMQITGETDARAAAALHDAMTRLLTFAEIHTQLRFAETEEVDLLAMTQRIAEVTRRVFAKADVEVQVEGDSVPCSAKEATPLFIVVNELITNAVKHGGQAEDGKLHVEVAVRQEAEKVRVGIWSSGNPPPEGFDPQQQRTMGLMLTWDVIVGRYQGTFTVQPERGGTRAEVEVGYGALRE